MFSSYCVLNVCFLLCVCAEFEVYMLMVTSLVRLASDYDVKYVFGCDVCADYVWNVKCVLNVWMGGWVSVCFLLVDGVCGCEVCAEYVPASHY